MFYVLVLSKRFIDTDNGWYTELLMGLVLMG